MALDVNLIKILRDELAGIKIVVIFKGCLFLEFIIDY